MCICGKHTHHDHANANTHDDSYELAHKHDGSY